MTRKGFEAELRKAAGARKCEIKACGNGTDYIISWKAKALLLRSFLQTDTDRDPELLRYPAPHSNVQSVAFYRINPIEGVYCPDIIAMISLNPVTGRELYLVARTGLLIEKLERAEIEPDKSGTYGLLLWIFGDNQVFLATDISCEGEWYLLGSGLWKKSERDMSDFVDNWNNAF